MQSIVELFLNKKGLPDTTALLVPTNFSVFRKGTELNYYTNPYTTFVFKILNTMAGKVLVTDGVDTSLLTELEKMGFEVDYQPSITLKDVLDIIQVYTGLIINSKILVDRHFLDKAVKLKFIGRLGSGMEIVDLDYAEKKKVAVFSAPEGNRNAVAEHALGMLLALANKMRVADREVRQFTWNREKNRGFEIMGKTIGIIGFGNTGSTFAQKLSGMNVKVLTYDKYKSNYAIESNFIRETNMPEIFERADLLSLHLPLTEETKHLVDYNYLKKFNKPIVLINTSRGPVVKTEDLLIYLQKNKNAGACLDVFENEKPAQFSEKEYKIYSELYRLDNVLLTPHVAGWTSESKKRLANVLLRKIQKFYLTE